MSIPVVSTDSYIYFDDFYMAELFKFVQIENLVGAVDTRAATGVLHTITRFQVEAFEINFPKLIQSESDQLRLILSQVGVNVLHTVIYGTPEMLRKWDGLTLPGYGINTDINRIRRKARVESWSMPHWDNVADVYSCSIRCVES